MIYQGKIANQRTTPSDIREWLNFANEEVPRMQQEN